MKNRSLEMSDPLMIFLYQFEKSQIKNCLFLLESCIMYATIFFLKKYHNMFLNILNIFAILNIYGSFFLAILIEKV